MCNQFIAQNMAFVNSKILWFTSVRDRVITGKLADLYIEAIGPKIFIYRQWNAGSI